MKTIFKKCFFLILLVYLHELSLAQTNVTISGKINEQNGETIRISTRGFNVFKGTEIANAVISDSGIFCLKFSITKPQVFSLNNPPFYVTPGDSVFGNYTGSFYMPETIEFMGRNADHYNYTMKYYSLKRSLHFKYYSYDFKKGLNNYLDSLNANKNILLNFLNEYSKYHTLTSDFKTYALNQIVYDFYDQLLTPFAYENYPIGQIPTSYSSILAQIKLTNDSLYDKQEYAFAANDLIQYRMKQLNDNELNVINKYSSGLTKEYLLTKYANTIILNYESKDSLLAKDLFKKIDTGIKDPELRKSFIVSKGLLKKSLTPFPKDVINTVLTDSIGHKLTFKDLLGKSKNKIIVLDFWASWCSPCKEGMPKVNLIIKNFSKADIEFVFISLDEKETNWRSSMKQMKIPGNHYRADENFKSALTKYLEIDGIPRYVIINKSGKLEKIKAFHPLPGENGLEFQVSKMLKQ